VSRWGERPALGKWGLRPASPGPKKPAALWNFAIGLTLAHSDRGGGSGVSMDPVPAKRPGQRQQGNTPSKTPSKEVENPPCIQKNRRGRCPRKAASTQVDPRFSATAAWARKPPRPKKARQTRIPASASTQVGPWAWQGPGPAPREGPSSLAFEQFSPGDFATQKSGRGTFKRPPSLPARRRKGIPLKWDLGAGRVPPSRVQPQRGRSPRLFYDRDFLLGGLGLFESKQRGKGPDPQPWGKNGEGHGAINQLLAFSPDWWPGLGDRGGNSGRGAILGRDEWLGNITPTY